MRNQATNNEMSDGGNYMKSLSELKPKATLCIHPRKCLTKTF